MVRGSYRGIGVLDIGTGVDECYGGWEFVEAGVGLLNIEKRGRENDKELC